MLSIRLFLLVLLGLYLADCLILLRPTQALAAVFRGAYSLDFGLSTYQVRRRIPLLLNPFTPWQIWFRTEPIAGAERSGIAPRGVPRMAVAAVSRYARRASPVIALQGLIVFVGLPGSLWLGQYRVLAGCVAVGFGLALIIVLLGWRPARVLGISGRAFAALAFQALICLPISVNFLRKIALINVFPHTAAELLPAVPPAVRAETAREIVRALSAAVLDEPDAGRRRALLAIREHAGAYDV
jgi:hypothetical protein